MRIFLFAVLLLVLKHTFTLIGGTMRIFLFAVLLLVIGCSNPVSINNNNTNPTPAGGSSKTSIQKGLFSVGLIHGLGKKQDTTVTDTTMTFNLGNINTSSSFYFILNNTGSIPITNVTISFPATFKDSNAITIKDTSIANAISASPKAINILYPQLINSAVKVNIIHGIALNGYGFTKVMSPGIHSATMFITGTTKIFTIKDSIGKDSISHKDTTSKDTSLNVSCNLVFNVNLMDIQMHTTDSIMHTDSIIHLGQPVAVTNALYDGISVNDQDYPAYISQSNRRALGTKLIINNTGTVTVTITIEHDSIVPGAFNGSGYIDTIMTIKPKDSVTIATIEYTTCAQGMHFKIDGGNVMTDFTKLPLSNDGNTYISLIAQLGLHTIYGGFLMKH